MRQIVDSAWDRRRFLKTLAWAAATTRAAFGKTRQETEIPIAVQMWPVREEAAKDLAGTLAALAEMGFQAVEFADYFGRGAAELRRELDKVGLRCCGTHIFLEDMQGDKLEPTVEFNQTLGNPNLVVRWLHEPLRSSPEAFSATIASFNEIAARLKPHGMRVGYHNHDYIFQRFGGELLWNLLADGTSSDVFLQLDTGNASHAGQDVIPLLKRNVGRTLSIHVKPYSAGNPKAYVGQDDLDWPQILKLCQTVGGTEWFIVEYEEEGVPPFQALKGNLEALRKLLGRA